MVKPTPDPPRINLPSDHPLLNFPSELTVVDGDVLAKRFAMQRALMKKAKRAEARRNGVLHWGWQALRRWLLLKGEGHE